MMGMDTGFSRKQRSKVACPCPFRTLHSNRKAAEGKTPKIESLEEKVIELERRLRAGSTLMENLSLTMDNFGRLWNIGSH